MGRYVFLVVKYVHNAVGCIEVIHFSTPKLVFFLSDDVFIDVLVKEFKCTHGHGKGCFAHVLEQLYF